MKAAIYIAAFFILIYNCMLVHGKQIQNNSIGKDKLSFNPGESFIYTQVTPSNMWVINHNLNKLVQVTIYDEENDIVEAQVENIDLNNITIYFNVNVSGYAVIN